MTRDHSVPTAQGEAEAEAWQGSLIDREVGDFVIKEQINEGGYGVIYRAEQKSLSRDVALKALRWKGSPRDERIQRFLREAQLASRLDHPYAAHIYAFGVEPDGLLWIAMELVHGTSLKVFLESNGAMSLPRFVPLLEMLCEVIHSAHQQGIVHRDIKPSNVMVLSRAGRLYPKLLDFGIARAIDLPRLPSGGDAVPDEASASTTDLLDDSESTGQSARLHRPNLDGRTTVDDVASHTPDMDSLTLTRGGVSIGSPPYMAPEQWATAARSDARADQYSLAILTYEAITGRRPFRAPNPTAMALAHASKPVPRLGPGFPSDLDDVLERALAKNPEDRYEDLLAFAGAFRAAAGLEIEPDPLPRLSSALRETLLARAPQPLADAVAVLETARSARRAVEASHRIIDVAAQMVGIIATAAVSRLGPELDPEIEEALRQLPGDRLSAAQWLELARVLTSPFADKPEAHPIPELVRLFTDSVHSPIAADPDDRDDRDDRDDIDEDDAQTVGMGVDARSSTSGSGYMHDSSDGTRRPNSHDDGDRTSTQTLLDRLIRPHERRKQEQPAGASTLADAHAVLLALLPDLARLLERLSFLCVYPLVARSHGRLEIRMGAQRLVRPLARVQGAVELCDGDVILTGPSGEVVLSLSPLCQLLPPAPGAAEEIFWFDGPSRFGARLISLPVGFERHDSDLWQWFRDNLPAAGPSQESDDAVGSASRAPYMGLASFSRDDADQYFGREREVEACVNRLRIEPFLAVVGPSGAGKSSFVQAGIVPAMAGYWHTITVRPGPSPIAQLAGRLEREGIADLGDLRDDLAGDIHMLGRILRQHAVATEKPLLLVIDQFEELFTLCLDADERRLYAGALLDVASQPDDPVRLIITLRDDFLLRAQQLPALRERLARALELLGTPPADDLERILVEPARRAGYEFEDPRLPQEMVVALADQPGALALLSFTAYKLWQLRDRQLRLLPRRAYRDLGGVGGALAQHAEETLAAMPAGRQALVREVFRQLVTAEGTRAVLTRSELGQILGDDEGAEVALETLITARLLVASEGEGAGSEDRIEVVHEALLSSWPRLVRWQREDAESVRLRDQLRAAARQWVERDRPRGLLWRGDALLEYQVWRARYRGALTDAELAFARASTYEDARGKRLRGTVVVSAFVILAVGLIVVIQLARRADAERQRAETFALEAQKHADESRARMLELYQEQGRQAWLGGDPLRALAYLREARAEGADSAALAFLLGRVSDALDDQQLAFLAHDGIIWSVRFSPDDSRIATAGADGTAKIWDARTGALVATLRGHAGPIWRIEFSPDGDRAVTASWDGTVRVWNVQTGALVWSAKHTGKVWFAAFTADGGRVVSTGEDRAARVWDARDGHLLETFAGQPGALRAAALSSQGTKLAAGDNHGDIWIWELETGRSVTYRTGDRGGVAHLRFSPDDTLVAAGTASKGVWLLPVFSGGNVRSLGGHELPVWQVGFSPDGKHLITASEDQTAKVWDVASGKLLFPLQGHTGGVTYAAFSRDGQRIFTASRDSTARAWNAATGALLWSFLGHNDGLWLSDLDRTGRRLVTTSYDGMVRVWDAQKTIHELVLPEHPRDVWQAAFNRDGSRIATVQDDGTVRIWDRAGNAIGSIATGLSRPTLGWNPDGRSILVAAGPQAVLYGIDAGNELTRFGAHGEATTCAAYTPDGRRVVTAGTDGTARLWDATSRELVSTFSGHSARINHVAFDTTGDRLITAASDKSVRIWNVKNGAIDRVLPMPTQHLHSARFSRDGTLVITAGEDKTAAIWRATGELVTLLEGHSSSIWSAALTVDDQLAATASEDGTVKLWDARSGRLLWSIDLALARALAVEIAPDGETLLAATGKTARLWSLDRDHRSADALGEFAACRDPYELVHGAIERIERDYAACARRASAAGSRPAKP